MVERIKGSAGQDLLQKGTVMEIKCTGQLTKNGTISVDPEFLSNIKSGSKLLMTITAPDMATAIEDTERMSPEAKELLSFFENAKPVGVPSDPEELSHGRLMEERMEEKFPWSE